MPRGGKRPGAGRPKGSRNRRTIAHQQQLDELQREMAESGVTPLACMLRAMEEAWARQDLEAAVRFARDAAPYCHPRLAAIEHTGPDGEDLIPVQQASPDQVARAIIDVLFAAGVRATTLPEPDDQEPEDTRYMNGGHHPSASDGPLAGEHDSLGAAAGGFVGPSVAATYPGEVYPNGRSALRDPPAGHGSRPADAAAGFICPAAAPSAPTEGRPLVLANGATIAFDPLLRKFAVFTSVNGGDLCGYRSQFERALELARNIK